jgi:hypothetical protein
VTINRKQPFFNPFPTPVDPNPAPEYTLPRKSVERGFDATDARVLLWQDPAIVTSLQQYGETTDVIVRAVVETPTYDLRPDLENAVSTQGKIEVVPIPRAGYLAVEFSNMEALRCLMDVRYIEWGEVTNPGNIRRRGPINTPQDISVNFWDGMGVTAGPSLIAPQKSVVLYFVPPDGVRYWQVAIVLDVITDEVSSLPPTIPTSLVSYRFVG